MERDEVTPAGIPTKGDVMDAHGIIVWLIVGAVAGWLAGMVVKGGGFGLIGDIIVGIVGAVIGGFIMQALVQGAWGVVPAHLSELSPDSVRGFLPGFGYQMGVLFSSAIPRIEADIAHRTSYAAAMSGTAAGVFLLAAIAISLGPERRAAKFGE